MNCLHVTASMDQTRGGLSQGIRNTVPELERLGVTNTVVCLDPPDALYPEQDTFKIIALGSIGPWAYSSNLIPWLKQNTEQYTVVVIHGLWLYHSYAATKAFLWVLNKAKNKDKSIQLFVMPHGMLDPYFQTAKDRKLKALRNWVFWKLIENKVVNKADGLLFTCQKELELARIPFTPYQPKREINVGFGTEEPPAYFTEMSSAYYSICPQVKGKNFLLFLSRIHQKKGVDLLVQAYKNLAEKGIDLPYLVIAGPGLDKHYGADIKQMVEQSEGIKHKIFFPGMLSGNTKWGAFYECEAFVLTSHQENFGIAVAEALACGKPVLISNQINISNEIEEDQAGLVEENTLPAIEKLLAQWISLPAEEKTTMGERARLSYEKNFAIASSAKKFYDAIVTENYFDGNH